MVTLHISENIHSKKPLTVNLICKYYWSFYLTILSDKIHRNVIVLVNNKSQKTWPSYRNHPSICPEVLMAVGVKIMVSWDPAPCTWKWKQQVPPKHETIYQTTWYHISDDHNQVLKLQVPYKAGNFLTSWAIASLCYMESSIILNNTSHLTIPVHSFLNSKVEEAKYDHSVSKQTNRETKYIQWQPQVMIRYFIMNGKLTHDICYDTAVYAVSD